MDILYEYEPPDEKQALEQLVGTLKFREVLDTNANLDEWIASWDLSEFMKRRADALMSARREKKITPLVPRSSRCIRKRCPACADASSRSTGSSGS